MTKPVRLVDAARDEFLAEVKRYPFVIVYRALPGEIRVLAMAATKRRPGYWRGRK